MDGKIAFRSALGIVAVDRWAARGAADAERDAVLRIRHSQRRALQIDCRRRELKRNLIRKHGDNLSGFADQPEAIVQRWAPACQRHRENKILIDQATECARGGAPSSTSLLV